MEPNSSNPPLAAGFDRPTSFWTPRVIPGVIFINCFGLLLLAAWLQADPQGHSTHRQLNLPPCGMMRAFNLPCMTCGMTTSFAHAADGNLWASFKTQPAGAMLAVATAMLAIVSGFATWTGTSLEPLARLVWRPRVFWPVAALVMIAWVYKIMMVRGVFQ